MQSRHDMCIMKYIAYTQNFYNKVLFQYTTQIEKSNSKQNYKLLYIIIIPKLEITESSFH